jgi:hypothetical protein
MPSPSPLRGEGGGRVICAALWGMRAGLATPGSRGMGVMVSLTYQRNYLTIVTCWIHVLTVTLGILLLVARKLPTTRQIRENLCPL